MKETNKTKTEQALASARDALRAIAGMQITDATDRAEVLALCMSIAEIELAVGLTYVDSKDATWNYYK